MELYAVIGKPLTHSLSADYFTHKFAAAGESDLREYRKMELESIEELPTMIAQYPTLRGFNVTHPYKEQIIPFLTDISKEARRIGAVNCVKVMEDGRLVGYNTDFEGFSLALREVTTTPHSKALVLGTGGASKAVCLALADLGVDYLRVSHSGNGDLSYENLTAEIIAEHTLIVNATPLGMFPNTHECPPLPYNLLTPNHLLFDLIYNPATSEFLRRGQERGTRICNGQRMFELQAESSYRIFTRF